MLLLLFFFSLDREKKCNFFLVVVCFAARTFLSPEMSSGILISAARQFLYHFDGTRSTLLGNLHRVRASRRHSFSCRPCCFDTWLFLLVRYDILGQFDSLPAFFPFDKNIMLFTGTGSYNSRLSCGTSECFYRSDGTLQGTYALGPDLPPSGGQGAVWTDGRCEACMCLLLFLLILCFFLNGGIAN